MSFKLPALNYSYDSLEPHVDANTMEIHHGKHHAGYTNNLNKAIKDSELEGNSIKEIKLSILCSFNFFSITFNARFILAKDLILKIFII